MLAPTEAKLLRTWEMAQARSPIHRAVALLQAACPEASFDDLADLSVGRRDALLLEVRERLFGDRLSVVAPCPRCRELAESSFLAEDLNAALLPEAPEAGRERSVAEDGFRVTFRLPSSRDLMAIGADGGNSGRRRALFARCVLRAEDSRGSQVDASSLPDSVVDAVSRGMSTADPAAHIELRFACSPCGNGWNATFDAAGFLWKEVQAWAHRTLRDVHTLARAYGWSEPDVLALGPTRRRIYVEMCSG